MKLIVLTIGIMSFFSCVNKQGLTKSETSLLDKLSIDKELIAELKNITEKEIKQLPAIDDETGEIINTKTFGGIYSESSDKKAIEIVKSLKPKFKKNGYLVFYTEGENGKQRICIIKGIEELDIFRYRKTNGLNYDLESKDVLKKITDWKSKYGLIIIGCGQDYVHIEFDNLPKNMNEFAKEVYDFCPDSVDQGVGDIESLKKYIIEEKGIWLWWD
jgi:Domain of unknown function (DUF4253)